MKNLKSSGVPLFLNILMCTQYDGFYTMELLGASSLPSKLSLKKRRNKDIYRYFDLFQVDKHGNKKEPLLVLGGGLVTFTQLCLAHEHDKDKVKERFPYIDFYESTIVRKNGTGSIVKFLENFECTYFERCSIINRESDIYRCKNILYLSIFRSGIWDSEVREFFDVTLYEKKKSGLVDVHGIFTARENEDCILKASQLQNLYLSDGIHETTIGDLLSSTPEVLKKAFNTEYFVYEPYLRWVEHDGTVEEEAINPDFLIQNRDGNYDILDLKLAKIGKKRLTKGMRNRRRFVDYVVEGISQLSNYKTYFEYEKNREYAKEHYNISVIDPRLILVVGNIENLDVQELKEAIRPYKDMDIVDYDTLISMFLKVSN